jgi:hypothetical protein
MVFDKNKFVQNDIFFRRGTKLFVVRIWAISSNARMTCAGRTEEGSDESDCDLTEALLRHLTARTEENHENLQS